MIVKILIWGVYMINKIDSISGVQAQYKINFKTNESFTKPEETKPEVSLIGTEALAVYNAPLLKYPEKLDVEPLTPMLIMPEDSDNLEGEKIYTSEGKLHSVVQEDENTKTVLRPDKENEGMFSSIVTIDKKTGKIIREQENLIRDGKYDEIYINEYSLETGKVIADTCYIEGKLNSASKTIHKPNQDFVVVRRNYEDDEYSVSKYSKNKDNSMRVIFDKNKQLKAARESKNVDLKASGIDVDFYNGGMISVHRYEEITVPNNFGADKLNDKNLVPSEKYNLDFDAKGLDGEKTYYSNGAIETNSFERNGEKIKADFSPSGELLKLELGEVKTVEFDGANQKIAENLEDGIVRVTTLYGDGSKSVRVEYDKEYKEVNFAKNGKPSSYREGTIDENGEDNKNLSLYFNKTGMLEAAYNF